MNSSVIYWARVFMFWPNDCLWYFVCLIRLFTSQSTFSVMSGCVFLGWTSTKQELICLAQGACEALTCNPWILTQIVYHLATELPYAVLITMTDYYYDLGVKVLGQKCFTNHDVNFYFDFIENVHIKHNDCLRCVVKMKVSENQYCLGIEGLGQKYL